VPRHAHRAARRLDRLRWWATFDWSPPHRPPTLGRFVLATASALSGSLVADGVVVAVTEHLYPSLRHYAHFTPVAWVGLSVIGILGASAGWPVVAAFTRRPRWLYGWMAFAVTLVLLLPDIALLGQGNPGKAVAALMTMHMTIAVVTFESLVRLAPERPIHHPWVDGVVEQLAPASGIGADRRWHAATVPPGAGPTWHDDAAGAGPAWHDDAAGAGHGPVPTRDGSLEPVR
jgi:hypothetical protein